MKKTEVKESGIYLFLLSGLGLIFFYFRSEPNYFSATIQQTVVQR